MATEKPGFLIDGIELSRGNALPLAPAPRASTAPPAAQWAGRLKTLVSWFSAHVKELPTVPFSLGAGAIRVADPALFYDALFRDIASGPTGARSRLGILEDELLILHDLWSTQRGST